MIFLIFNKKRMKTQVELAMLQKDKLANSKGPPARFQMLDTGTSIVYINTIICGSNASK